MFLVLLLISIMIWIYGDEMLLALGQWWRRRKTLKKRKDDLWWDNQCNCSVHDIHPDDIGAAHARDCPKYD